jgi:hypothetical protein
MSALPPKADMCSAPAHVRFGSKADICAAKSDVRFTLNRDRKSGYPHKVKSALPPEADMCSALAHVCFVPCVDVYGPRPIATGRRDQVQWSQLLTYIRLPDAARYFVAASPDGFSRASTSTAPRHGRGHAGPHTRFRKRRNDRFAISCHFVAIAG